MIFECEFCATYLNQDDRMGVDRYYCMACHRLGWIAHTTLLLLEDAAADNVAYQEDP